MALHFDLCVNHEQIGRFIAQRRDDAIPADRVCTYDITVISGDVKRQAVVRHNYDHGAPALVAAGIQAATDTSATEALDGAMHSVWLHGDWYWLTRNMTTPEKEAAADAVDRYSASLDAFDGETGPAVDRWWR